MMLGARLGDVELLGVAERAGRGGAACGVAADHPRQPARHRSRLNTWYSLVPSTAIFLLLSLMTQTWNPPQSTLGWAAFVGMSVTSTISVLTIFISITRIGAFRTALIMNLEPLVSTLASVALLGEVLRPVQAFGGR